jgi:hypothetical protein
MKFLKPVRSSAHHFRYVMIGHVAHILARLPEPTATALSDAIPAIADYRQVAADCWRDGDTASGAVWQRAVSALLASRVNSPLSRLARLAPSPLHINVLLTMLMAEEDAALAQLVEPDGGFPTMGGLMAVWRMQGRVDDPSAVRLAITDLADLSLIAPLDGVTPANEQRYRVLPAVAELLAGMQPHWAGVFYTPAAKIDRGNEWISPDANLADPHAVALIVRQSHNPVLVVRGHSHNGRSTYVHKIARHAGLGTLNVAPEIAMDTQKWQLASTLAVLGDAILVCRIDPGPGETAVFPNPANAAVPVAIITGLSGAIHTGGDSVPLTIRIGLPRREARISHWRASGLIAIADELTPMILPSGNIRRSAKAAAMLAALDGGGEGEVRIAHVRFALRNLRDARLDALATRIDVDHEPDPLFLDTEAQEEFGALLVRCIQREQLGTEDGNIGVRALLSGPSGTGKTLAARHIARALGKDIFRVDLSATVNKYIGETEKALERLLSAAEELDIVLLLDEGDALMAKRTDVANSNDRYANLETNFLLQRIEQFSGIILITSNDADRIDGAFTRRMDAVIDFAAPDELRRQDILLRMLGENKISGALLHDIACRCALTGGQLRNVVLHARLLALDAGSCIGDCQLRAAIEREYRKIGAPCPLRRPLAAVG